MFFPRIFKTLQPPPRQYLAVIGRSENGQPIGVTVHSNESVSYVQGMGCNELGKNTIFNKHSVLTCKEDICDILRLPCTTYSDFGLTYDSSQVRKSQRKTPVNMHAQRFLCLSFSAIDF